MNEPIAFMSYAQRDDKDNRLTKLRDLGRCCSFPMKERILLPALQPRIIEPIWQQFSALLPEREVKPPA